MKEIAVYLMLVLGGNATPSADDVKKALSAVGLDVNSCHLSKLISDLEGKDLDEVIRSGTELLAKFEDGGPGLTGTMTRKERDSRRVIVNMLEKTSRPWLKIDCCGKIDKGISIPSISFVSNPDSSHYETIQFPLSTEHHELIKTVSTKSKVGCKGEEILKPVKRVSYEFGLDDCLTDINTTWKEQPRFHRIMSNIQHELGIVHEIDADFYKFLLYEPGCFFANHRDHERIPGQLATLVVQLPSVYTGGALYVWPPNRSVDDDHDEGPKPSSSLLLGKEDGEIDQLMSYAAFYSDCFHEVTNLEEGLRFVAIFSIKAKPVGSGQPSLLSDMANGSLFASCLQNWYGSVSLPPAPSLSHKLFIPLLHSYTRRSLQIQEGTTLRLESLKGSDIDTIKLITEALHQTDAFQALVFLTNPNGPDRQLIDCTTHRIIADTDFGHFDLPGREMLNQLTYGSRNGRCRVAIFEHSVLRDVRMLSTRQSGNYQRAFILIYPTAEHHNVLNDMRNYHHSSIPHAYDDYIDYDDIEDGVDWDECYFGDNAGDYTGDY